MALKIYTKTGDQGKTSLIGGTKVPKSHLRIETYGTVDELNSYVGMVSDLVTDAATKAVLKEIQDRLFTIGASLASDPEKEPLMKIPDLKESDITALEKEIDRMNEVLPPMKSFILPGGSALAAHLHLCRTITRRAERLVILLADDEPVGKPAIKYLNRLSDWFFVMARVANNNGVDDVLWVPGANR